MEDELTKLNEKPNVFREVDFPQIESEVVYSDKTVYLPFGLPEAEKLKKKPLQVSLTHGRAVVLGDVLGKVVWSDKFDCLFGAIDYKGAIISADFSKLVLEKDEYSPFGIRAEGLLAVKKYSSFESSVLSRIVKVSDYLRANRLPTEVPLEIRKITKVFFKGKLLTTEEAKEEYLQKLKEPLLFDKKKFLENTDFFIVVRAVQVPQRLMDLIHPETSFSPTVILDNVYFEQQRKQKELFTEKDFHYVLDPALKWLNSALRLKKEGILCRKEISGPFNPASKEDLERYLYYWLPEQMGRYLGRLHKLGIRHGFATRNNWSLVGTLYDLDSVTGEVFGDRIPTNEELTKEAINTQTDLMFILRGLGRFVPGNTDTLDEVTERYYLGYFSERFKGIPKTHFDEIIKKNFPFHLFYEPGLTGDINDHAEEQNELYKSYLIFWEKIKQRLS